jgi:Tfp pilus assembly protein PilX
MDGVMNMKHQIERALAPASRQRGAVLLIALVVLVAMTLSALALIRSVSTTNLVAGNLAFREAALLSAERASEAAVTAWLAPKAGKSDLHSDNDDAAYYATRQDPGDGNWGTFWGTLPNRKLAKTSADGTEDAAGNKVEYVIHRLCDGAGDPDGGDPANFPNCSRPPYSSEGDSKSIVGGALGLLNPQVYYRITARVAGPRNTVVFTQTIVAL